MDLPTGVDLELPSGLTTLLSLSDDSVNEARNSTTISDPSGYFDSEEIEEVDLAQVGLSVCVENSSCTVAYLPIETNALNN